MGKIYTHIHTILTFASLKHTRRHTHRNTSEILEPEPSLSRHIQFGGLQVFPIIKLTMVCQVCLSPGSNAVCVKRKHLQNGARCVKIMGSIGLCLFLHAWSAKIWRPPIWTLRLTMPLHGCVQCVESPWYICGCTQISLPS